MNCLALENHLGKILIIFCFMDKLANALTKIRNAQAVGNKTIEVPNIKVVKNLMALLAEEGYLGSIKESEKVVKGKKTPAQILEVQLKYKDKACKEPAISSIKKISKQGRRVYVPTYEIKRVLSGKGIGVYSTSKGLLTNNRAKKEKVGGEYICEVW